MAKIKWTKSEFESSCFMLQKSAPNTVIDFGHTFLDVNLV